MRKSTEIGLGITVLLVLFAPIVYVVWYPPSKEFWDSVASGLLSTAVALIAGIPVALWIDRAIKHREELKAKSEKRKRELELLKLIKEELDFTNSSHITRKGVTDSLPIQPLKSDLWAAITTAGKLNLISNHKLLNRITSAYYVINVVKNIEEQAYRASRSAAVSFPGGKTATLILIEDARKFDTLLSESITKAQREIDDELSISA